MIFKQWIVITYNLKQNIHYNQNSMIVEIVQNDYTNMFSFD